MIILEVSAIDKEFKDAYSINVWHKGESWWIIFQILISTFSKMLTDWAPVPN